MNESALIHAETTAQADRVYRPFFMAALLVIVTVGAGWGVLLLWKIGVSGSFTGVTVHEVNAHGHAQIMGWVGLFIMGFAYQAFPRLWRAPPPPVRVALVSLWVMLGGIGARAMAMMFSAAAWSRPAHGAGVALEAAAGLIFLWLIIRAFVRSGQRVSPSAAFILAALVCFVGQILFSGWHVGALMAAPTRAALLEQIATYQAPLRDVQIHGMAMLMIFGVGLHVFPAFFRFREVPERRAWRAFGLLTSAVVLEVGLFLGYRATGSHTLAGALLAPWMMLPVGAWLLVGAWRPWASGEPERSRKFVLAAMVWLGVSFGLLLAMPAYLAMYDGAFSHAYHGAIRHAITVGFVSMMIVGMGARVVAALNGLDTRTLTALWGPFVLIQLGCLLRVVLQIATDWAPAVFPMIGVSGALELIGLGWWATHLGLMMRNRETRGLGEEEVRYASAPCR